MEKKTAHYPLSDIHALVQKGRVQATRTALESAAALGFTLDDIKLQIVGDVVIVSFKEL